MANELLITARAFHYAAGMVLVAVMAFRWLILLPAFAGAGAEAWSQITHVLLRRLGWLFVAAQIVLLISGGAIFWAVTAVMADCSLADALGADNLGAVFFQTHFGAVCQWRLVIAALLASLTTALMIRCDFLRPRLSLLEVLAGIPAAALVVSLAWAGHAAASGGAAAPLRIGADALHLLAASIWPGWLLPFGLFLGCWLRVADNTNAQRGVVAIRRFSDISLGVVALLIATGVINSIFLVGSFAALFASAYGQILCLKIFLLGLILCIASWNRFRLVPAVKAEKRNFALPVARLRFFVMMELVLATAIVVVVSFLGTTAPPR